MAGDPYFTAFGELFAAGDRDGLAGLGLRTWAACGADEAACAQVASAVQAFFGLGDYEQPDPPAYARLGEIAVPATVVIGDKDHPMVVRCAHEIAARIPGCRRFDLTGADHLLPLRVPTQVAALAAELGGRRRPVP